VCRPGRVQWPNSRSACANTCTVTGSVSPTGVWVAMRATDFSPRSLPSTLMMMWMGCLGFICSPTSVDIRHERRQPHLKIESGEAVVQHHCWQCRRDLVTVLSSGRRHAVQASIPCFFRLDDEVTERWLNKLCPGARLASDDEDRKRLVAKSVRFDSGSKSPDFPVVGMATRWAN
jgi:hypothetical protein